MLDRMGGRAQVPAALRWDLTTSIRAILFDFDGTLVDSEPLHYEAWSAAVRDYGAGAGWDDYRRRYVGKTDRWAGRAFLSEAGHPADEETVSLVCARKHAYYREKTPERLSIAPAVRMFIHEALAGLPLGIVSSSPLIDVRPTVERAELAEHFEFFVTGEDVRRHKPDPEPYLLALERLNATGRALRESEVLVFEDSASGIAAAQAAGMRVAAVESPDRLIDLARTELSRLGLVR